MILLNSMPVLASKLSNVYGYPLRIRGPYIWKKNRRKIIDVLPLDSSSEGKTMLLAKAKLEIKLNRKLKEGETVDHIDDDLTNDKYSNTPLCDAGNSTTCE